MLREKISPVLLKLYKPDVMKYLQQNRKLYINKENLFYYQWFRLQKLLLHAYNKTEYYHRIFDDIELIRNQKIDWRKFHDIPLLTKEIIRDSYDQLIAKDYKKRNPYENSSGGSTGEPVTFVQDKNYYHRMVADTLFFAELAGKQLGQREIKIWGSEKDIFNERKSIFNRLILYFFNRILLNSFRMNNQLINNYIEVINEVKPRMIWTYVDSIFEIAKYINRQRMRHTFQPNSIVCTAGTMYDELHKEIIEAFPKSKIFNQYGSREVGIIGIGEENISVFQQSIYLELFDKMSGTYVKDSGTGNVIVTALNNYSMPLIKYDIGDIGESSDIDDTNVRSLTKLNGRENAHIIRRDGTIIHGELFTHLFYFHDEIQKFQVIQEDYEQFTINLELSSQNISQEKLDHIRYRINQIMDTECDISIHKLKHLPKLKSGKYLFVFSKVRDDGS